MKRVPKRVPEMSNRRITLSPLIVRRLAKYAQKLVAQVSRVRQLHRDFEALKPSLESFSSTEGAFHDNVKLIGSCAWCGWEGVSFDACVDGIPIGQVECEVKRRGFSTILRIFCKAG